MRDSMGGGDANRGGATVLGPENRESFFEVQARDRRASWQLAAACLFSVALMAGALVLTLAPPIIAVAILATDAVSLFIPSVPNLVAIGRDVSPALAVFVPWIVLAAIVGPGALIAAAAWRTVRPLTLESEVAGLAANAAPRDPRAGDLEEVQIANVVSEMAVAAGIPPPRVQLLDRADINAFAAGAAIESATVVVTRGLLDALDREETQAIIGHLVASIGNGDLRIAHDVLSTYAAVGFIERLPFAPLDPSMRAWLGDIHRAARSPAASRETLTAFTSQLYKHPDQQDDVLNSGGDLLARLRRQSTGTVSSLGNLPKPLAEALAWPLMYVSIAQIACRLALLDLLINPLLAVLWRRRRLLADASAVQLCRDPTPLARALDKLSNQEAAPIGEPLLSFLLPALPTRRMKDDAVNFGGGSGLFPAKVAPEIRDRLARLRRMGAQYGGAGKERTGWWRVLAIVGHVLVIVLKTALWAFCFAVASFALLASIFMGAPMAFFMLVLFPHVIMRMLIPWLLGR